MGFFLWLGKEAYGNGMPEVDSGGQSPEAHEPLAQSCRHTDQGTQIGKKKY